MVKSVFEQPCVSILRLLQWS